MVGLWETCLLRVKWIGGVYASHRETEEASSWVQACCSAAHQNCSGCGSSKQREGSEERYCHGVCRLLMHQKEMLREVVNMYKKCDWDQIQPT
ncbi:hypothetical protein GN956_G6252 [Arapaima gigas]